MSRAPATQLPDARAAMPEASWRACALAALLYSLAIALFFAPAWPHLATDYLGDGGDTFQFAWNAWWMDHSLLHGRNPWFCDTQLLPPGTPLALHTLSELPMTLVALLSRPAGSVLAYNLVLLAAFPLAGVCMFLLARECAGGGVAAFVGGLAFMLCPFFASRYLGHFNLMFAGLLPLAALCLIRDLARETPRGSARIAWLFAALLLCNIHTAILAANLFAWTLVWRAIRRRDLRGEFRRFARALWPTLCVVGGYGAILAYFTIRYGLTPQRYGDPVFCPDLLSFVLPLHSSAWLRPLAAAGVAHADELGGIELSVYIGLFVLVIAVAGWSRQRRDPQARWSLMIFLVALILAAGPFLQWDRQVVHVAGVKAYLPMALYRHLPLLGIIGQSGRYMVLGYMGLSLGVALAVASARKSKRRWLRAAGPLVICVLVIADYGFRPQWSRPPEVIVPPGPGRVFDPRIGNAKALYGQTVHGRGLVGGYVARIPAPVRALYLSNPGVGWFFGKPGRRGSPPDRAALLAQLRAWDVAYITVDAGSEESRLLDRWALPRLGSTADDDVYVVK